MTALSPFMRRFLALGIGLAALWALLSSASALISQRIAMQDAIDSARHRYLVLREREIDAVSLNAQLAHLLGSSDFKDRVIIADTPNAALAELERVLRKQVGLASGSLLLLAPEGPPSATLKTVGVHVKARIAASRFRSLIVGIEHGPPHLQISDFSVTSIEQRSSSEPQLDVLASVRSPWLSPTGGRP